MLVVVVSAVEVVVVAGGVVERREWVEFHLLDGGGVEAKAEALDILLISGEVELVVGGEPVETHILDGASLPGVVKGVGERVLSGYASPNGLAEVLGVAVDRDTVFVALETILEDILGYLTEVDIEVAALVVGVVGVEEWVHEPELDVLDVALLEVGVVELAHDAAPSAFGVEEVALCIDVVGIEVVGTALVGVE